ncbi:hypothetical protein JB92DRAFT_2925912, partial [Gautieria morchelliformis]
LEVPASVNCSRSRVPSTEAMYKCCGGQQLIDLYIILQLLSALLVEGVLVGMSVLAHGGFRVEGKSAIAMPRPGSSCVFFALFNIFFGRRVQRSAPFNLVDSW